MTTAQEILRREIVRIKGIKEQVLGSRSNLNSCRFIWVSNSERWDFSPITFSHKTSEFHYILYQLAEHSRDSGNTAKISHNSSNSNLFTDTVDLSLFEEDSMVPVLSTRLLLPKGVLRNGYS